MTSSSEISGRTIFFTSPTIQRNRLLRPFPHMSSEDGLENRDLPVGSNRAHSIEISLTWRFANGFTAGVFYTGTRLRENRTVEEYERESTMRFVTFVTTFNF